MIAKKTPPHGRNEVIFSKLLNIRVSLLISRRFAKHLLVWYEVWYVWLMNFRLNCDGTGWDMSQKARNTDRTIIYYKSWDGTYDESLDLGHRSRMET